MEKLYDRIIFDNGTVPALNDTNLNAMSKALDDIDDRVILLGDDVLVVIPQIQAYLEQAETIEEALEQLSQNPPYIGANGHWYTFDTSTEEYVDSGVDASISVQIADVTMLAEGSLPYVTNTGTDTDPVFHLFIPVGATGNGIASIAKTSTSGNVDTYTITMTNGNTATFTVTNATAGAIANLSDVTLNNLSNGQILVYNSTSQKWENGTPASGGVSSFNGRTGAVSPAANDYSGAQVSYSNTTSGLTATDVQAAIDEVNGKIPTVPTWSSSVSCAVGATSATITNAAISTTSVVEPFCSLSTPMAYTSITVTTGQAVIAFDALASAADFKVRITN